jgi:serine phosphatase RsbU (regulator of sigma subunit)
VTTTDDAAHFRDLYTSTLQEDAAAPTEDALHLAYELGREAVAKGLSLLDLTHIHHQVLASRLESCERRDIRAVVETASQSFLQTLSAYEMIQRGFTEAQRELQSERKHAHQLRQLADSSLAVNSNLSVEDMLEAVTDHSRLIVGADCCIAGVTGANADNAKTAISRSSAWAGWDLLMKDAIVSKLHSLAMLLDQPVMFAGDEPPAGFPVVGDGGVPAGELLLAPLKRQGHHCVGFILFANRIRGGFTDKDQSILIQLAQTVSAAIDNAVLYARDRRVAEMLQRGLLPRALPEVPGLAVAAGYRPGAAGLNVGGDWYDVVRLPHDQTGLVIGDVGGRGVQAATKMGQIRTAFRAYSIDGSPPEKVIIRLDRLMSALDPDHFSTVAYLVWDPAEGRARTVVAGHPPPLLIDSSGDWRFLDRDASVPLGTMDDFPYGSVETSIDVGATLVMYTDGLVEHGGELDDNLRDLAGIASAHKGALPEELCDRILGTMLTSDADDDVAVVVVRFLSQADATGS